MEEFVSRPYRRGDEHSINQGFNQVFSLQRSLEEWRWKFQPDADGCRIIVSVNQDDQVIAHFAAIRVPVQVDSRIMFAGQSVDDYCLKQSEAIRQQIYIKTAQSFYNRYGSPDDVAFLFGFPGERHMKLGQLKLEFAPPVPMRVWRRRAIDRRVWWSLYRVRENFDPLEMDRLWQSAAHRYPVCVVRDSAWLKRRYLSRPNNEYVHLTAWRKGKAHAWIVLQVAGETVHLIDLLWNGKDPRSITALETEAARIARSKGAANLEMWLSGDKQAEEVLLSRGWESVEHPQRLHMTSVAFDPSLDAADLIRRFYITMGDSDLY